MNREDCLWNGFRATIVWSGAAILMLSAAVSFAAADTTLRPPAVPLVVCDPYFSIWSPADKLTDTSTCHWTGKRQAMTSLVLVDGKAYRLMGDQPQDIPAAQQVRLSVLPTQTIYSFTVEGVNIDVRFLQPALPDDIEWMASPIVYVRWAFSASDSKPHQVQVYFDSTAEPAVNEPSQEVDFSAETIGSLSVLRTGTTDQNVLGKKGDDIRIDWGYFYVAAPTNDIAASGFANADEARKAFAQNAALPAVKEAKPAAVKDAPVLAVASKAMKLTDKAEFGIILSYDDIYSIQYISQKLRPYWKRGGLDIAGLLKKAVAEYSTLNTRCAAFDKELMADLTAIGGEKYAKIAALAYRQCIAGNKIAADSKGMPLVFPKENHSNGCIATVDVFYPMAPQFLLLNPMLAKGAFLPILDYAASERWKFPFAPHDLGTYPMATGQVYGGGEATEENQMPVEECGNMLLLVAATCQAEGNADFARKHWPVLTKWAKYLESKGLDPENQLCTDDFAGHLAHNVNLSAKAILGLAAYGKMAGMLGDKAESEKYLTIAKGFAAEWAKMADNGDHYRLAFDKEGSWSQKYNLVWDRLLDLNIFPADVTKKELAYYRTMMNKYGLPLDNRSKYTKLDWIVWTATLTGDKQDFITLTDPIYTFLNETDNRSPMTDWYWTHDAKKVGFTARPVVGGVFIKMMDDKTMWKKWVDKAQNLTKPWADFPKQPKITVIIPSSQKEGHPWYYTTEKPADGWTEKTFEPADWKQGIGGFGTRNTPGARVRTEWNTSDIWIIRDFNLSSKDIKNPHLMIHHDENAEVYINGVQAAKLGGYSSQYDYVAISEKAAATLKAGKNRVAVHCHQTEGGQYIDLGICDYQIQE